MASISTTLAVTDPLKTKKVGQVKSGYKKQMLQKLVFRMKITANKIILCIVKTTKLDNHADLVPANFT